MQLYGFQKLLYAAVRPTQVTVCSCTASKSYCMQLYDLHKLLYAACRYSSTTINIHSNFTTPSVLISVGRWAFKVTGNSILSP